MMATAAAKPSAVTAVRPAPGVEIAPPVTPNLVRAHEVATARKVGESTIETLLFRGLSTPIAMILVVLQSRFLHPSGRGAFMLVVLSVSILTRLFASVSPRVRSSVAFSAVRQSTGSLRSRCSVPHARGGSW